MSEETITEVLCDQVDYKAQKQLLVAQKQSLSARLSEINTACKVRIPTKQYHKLQSERGQLASSVARIEAEISQVNQRLAETNVVLGSKNEYKKIAVEMVRQLVATRDKYHEISMDATQPSSARRIAFAASQEIRAALKPYFDQP